VGASNSIKACCSTSLSSARPTIVNGVRGKSDNVSTPRLAHAPALAAALNLDMTVWFTPTAENYFGRIGKQQLLSDLAEARGTSNAPAWEKLKKTELAALAERETAGKGWLPALLR
jgi:ParB family chromosome partitioning protein